MVAFARRSPRARLYSLVPRSSQCPSISTRCSAFDFSQDALASSVFASSGRMSYLSNSKKTSFKASMAANSFGEGLGAAGPASGAAGAGAGAAVLGAAGVDGAVARGAGAGAGAGAADEAVVAGFFAQPPMISPTSSTDDNVACAARVSMTPPLDSALRSTFGTQSYHGRRGDQEGLVASLVPCVTCVVVRPSTDMKNNCQRPVRFDWNARCRPSGAQVAP